MQSWLPPRESYDREASSDDILSSDAEGKDDEDSKAPSVLEGHKDTDSVDADARADGYFVLKVERRWLGRIYEAAAPFAEPKRIEVRGYPVDRHAPKGEDKPRCGETVYLACAGELWGTARIARVVEYASRETFVADEARHQVAPATATAGKMKYDAIIGRFAKGGTFFGWHLDEVVWHRANERPRTGGTFRGMPVPVFKDAGMVWALCGRVSAHFAPGSPGSSGGHNVAAATAPTRLGAPQAKSAAAPKSKRQAARKDDKEQTKKRKRTRPAAQTAQGLGEEHHAERSPHTPKTKWAARRKKETQGAA